MIQYIGTQSIFISATYALIEQLFKLDAFFVWTLLLLIRCNNKNYVKGTLFSEFGGKRETDFISVIPRST